MLHTKRAGIHELIVFDDTDRQARDFLPANKLLQKRFQLLHVPLIRLNRSHCATRSAAGDHQSAQQRDNAFPLSVCHFAGNGTLGGRRD
jgi:hypothetical protein